jgi:murein DD-endopeptidase MepM/ murein hydrolase activator NlpD
MANMLMDDRRRFPRLWYWLCSELPQSFADHTILAAFTNHSGLNEADARAAVEHQDTPPWVHVREITPDGRVFGRFTPDAPGRILLSDRVAAAYERTPDTPDAKRFVQAKVLHELVHWGCFRGNLPDVEAGQAFEQQVYGRIVEPFWNDVVTELRYAFPVDGVVGSGNSYWGKAIRQNNSRDHYGVDIHAPFGTPVYAIADASVITSDSRYRVGGPYLLQDDNYGQMVDLDHHNGLVSRYAHLQTVEITPATVVKRGMRIGTVGATGTQLGRWIAEGQHGAKPAGATGPHLHFELRNRVGQAFRDFAVTRDPGTVFPWLGLGAAARGKQTAALRDGVAITGEGVPAAAASTAPPPTSRGGDSAPYPGDVPPDAPRGLRNNNPGNIKHSPASRNDPWVGQLPAAQQHDATFLQFAEMKFGIRAVARCLRSYRARGVDTIAAMARTWAPSIDNNNPGAYAQTVLHFCPTVASVDTVIDLTAADIAFGVVRGIIVAENGGKWSPLISDDTVRAGIELERA